MADEKKCSQCHEPLAGSTWKCAKCDAPLCDSRGCRELHQDKNHSDRHTNYAATPKQNDRGPTAFRV